MAVSYLVGDVFDRLAEIPDGSVSLVATSPPFIALRSYLPPDHPDKAKEVGSEPDPGAFIQTLLELTAEWGRVLAPWGSIAIELGDTYSGSGGAGGDYAEGGLREGQQRFDGSSSRAYGVGAAPRPPRNGRRQRAQDVEDGILAPLSRPGPEGRDTIPGWPLAKSLALIPQMYAGSLVYGRNLITGEVSPAGRWRVRNEIVWHRPNPAVGALGDKVRPSTSYICVATRSARRWFDLSAARKPAIDQRTRTTNGTKMIAGDPSEVMTANYQQRVPSNIAGAPPLDCWFDEYNEHDVWTQTTQPSQLAHYAMWPPKLAERLILMMAPREVCAVCDEPRRRIERTTNAVGKAVGRAAWTNDADTTALMHSGTITLEANDRSVPDISERETLGWTDCGHGSFRPGVVLDPFAGTGTTLCVADIHGRDAIGIDIDERNEQLVPARHRECLRALGLATALKPEVAGQLDIFGAAS